MSVFLLGLAMNFAWAERVLPPGPPEVTAWVEATHCSADESDAAWLSPRFRETPPATATGEYFHSVVLQSTLRPAGTLIQRSYKGLKKLAGREGFSSALRGCMQMTGLRECGKYRYFQGCMASMMTAFAGEDVVEGLTDLAGLMHYRSLADVTVARCQRRLSTDPVACLDAASVRNQVHGLVWSTLGRWLEEGAPAESISARVETWDTDEGIASLVDSALNPTPSAGAASP